MTRATQLRTPRLLLRQWRPADEIVMARINSDPEVTRYLNRPIGRASTRAFYAAVLSHWDEHGFGFWAVESSELATAGAFLGFIGLGYPAFLPAVAHRVEVGWRLARTAWGRGLATEGAAAARDYAFKTLGLSELISIIHPENERSRRVAAKLGMIVAERVENPIMGREVEVWQISSESTAASPPRAPA